MGRVATNFREGSSRFFHKGPNQRWPGVFRTDDLALYDAEVSARLSPACARWAANRHQA